MNDQAQKLREMVRSREAASRCKVVAITSGKGGTGKTHLAVNLAVALSSRGHRVILVDLDLGLANADVLLNVDARHNLAHVLLGQKTLAQVLVEVAPGLSLLPGASGVSRIANLDDAQRESLLADLEGLEGSADFLIVDTGAGISKNVVRFACAADETIVVTTPEPTSVLDAFAMIKMIAAWHLPDRLRLVVNQVRDRNEARLIADKIAAVSRQLLKAPVEKMGYVLADYRLQEAVRRRRPVLWDAPQAASSACFQTLAGLVAGRAVSAAGVHRGPSGFFRRVAQLWSGSVSGGA